MDAFGPRRRSVNRSPADLSASRKICPQNPHYEAPRRRRIGRWARANVACCSISGPAWSGVPSLPIRHGWHTQAAQPWSRGAENLGNSACGGARIASVSLVKGRGWGKQPVHGRRASMTRRRERDFGVAGYGEFFVHRNGTFDRSATCHGFRSPSRTTSRPRTNDG